MAMTKNPFNGNLNSNEIFSAIYNMIISQDVFADNIKGTYGALVDKYKIDGTLYGDTKLYYATDCLESYAWGNDAEAANLLALKRPAAPKCQAVTIDKFRQIKLTVDDYLTKRAWSTEGAFSSFNSVMLGWISETKRIYESTLFNAYVGTVEGNSTKKTLTINLDSAQQGDPLYGLNGNEAANQEAMIIAKSVADLLIEMKDVSRDYNDYSFLRSYDEGDLLFVWSSKWNTKIKKIDLPTIFHKDGIMDKMDEMVLPSRFFGRDVVVSTDCGSGKVIKQNGEVDTTQGTVRTKVEKVFTFSGNTVHYFPGDALAAGVKVSYTGGSVSNPDFAQDEVYIEDANVICKVVHKKSFPFMSAFSVSTSFFNPQSLTNSHMLTWGYSHPDYLRNYPIVKVVKK